MSDKLRELVQRALANDERKAMESFVRMTGFELPPHAHDWNQDTGLCRKCGMDWEHYYRFDRPICSGT